MSFTLRFILGFALVLLSFSLLNCATTRRYIRQISPIEAPLESENIQDAYNKSETSSLKDIANEIKVSKEKVEEVKSKSKTEINPISKTLTVNKTIESNDKLLISKEIVDNLTTTEGSLLNHTDSITKGSKQANLENGMIATEVPDITEESLVSRAENGRFLDIDISKYVSPEFHNKNNVYTFSESPETARFTNLHNQLPKSTTLNTNIVRNEQSTTTHYDDFDKKYKNLEKGVNQKLEYIDHKFSKADYEFKKTFDEPINITKIINEIKNNNSTVQLGLIKFKNITLSDDKDRNKVHKELDFETGQSIDYISFNNNTQVYDAPPKDYKNKIPTHEDEVLSETLPEHTDSKLLQKAVLKRVDDKHKEIEISNENVPEIINFKQDESSNVNETNEDKPILSNKIETDVVSPEENNVKIKKWNLSYVSTTTASSTILKTTHNSLGQKEQTVYVPYDKNYLINVSKRGSTRYVDTMKTFTTTESDFATDTTFRNKENRITEQSVLENQIYPVQVPSPNKDNYQEKVIQDQTEKSVTSDISTLPLNSDDNFTISNKLADLKNETETTILEMETSESSTYAYESSITTTVAVEKTRIEDTSTGAPSETSEMLESITTEIPPTEIDVIDLTMGKDVTTVSYKVTTGVIDSDNSMKSEEYTKENILYNTPKYWEDNATTTDTYDNENSTSINLHYTDDDSKFYNSEEFSSIATTIDDINLTTQPLLDKTNITDTESNLNNSHRMIEVPTTMISMNLNITDEEPVTEDTTDYEVPEQLNLTTMVIMQNNDTTPFIIPLNISMFETDSTDSTTMSENSELGSNDKDENKGGKIAAIVFSCIGAICLIILAVLLIVMRKRHKRFNYGQRCTPVSLDAYSVDNVSMHNSMRRKGAIRNSKRSYRNPAFDDPLSPTHPLKFQGLAKFASDAEGISKEFDDVPQVTAQTSELPEGCDTKNRYANVIPLPETRVFLSAKDGYPNSDYINANYVTGFKGAKGYYIACQAPLQNTIDDFWRMVWEQQSKVILMLTKLFENGTEKCVDYLPPSEVLDCHRLFGDFQITLKKREVKEKYVISSLQLKNMVSNSWREVTHLWYLGWPEKGVPSEANSLIAFLIEARSYIKATALPENERQKDTIHYQVNNGMTSPEQSPVIVHCSPGTGRTGTVIACDIAIREFELTRVVDIPKTVYYIRRDRASSVQTKEQYAFIYTVICLYATKLTGGVFDSL